MNKAIGPHRHSQNLLQESALLFLLFSSMDYVFLSRKKNVEKKRKLGIDLFENSVVLFESTVEENMRLAE